METSLVSLGLFVQVTLLALALFLGQLIARKNIRWLGEAAAALGLGVLIGLIAKVSGAGPQLKDILAFKGDFFLLALLPPIMFDAGFSLNLDLFMAHLLPIILFAFLGTTLSMLLVGVTMWAAGVWGWIHALSPLRAMLFGAMISATDPVTVLAVFKKLGARADLYMVVFGESVLNDAVGIVLYQTIVQFLDEGVAVNAKEVFKGIGLFCGIFLASTAIGVIVGLISAAVTATGFFRDPEGPSEAGFVAMAAVASYFATQAAGLSGIVAIIFCGITINKVTKPHLNHASLHQLEAFFQMAATLAELFVFIYIGTMLFVDSQEWHGIAAFTAVALVALAHSRAAHIVPFSFVTNAVRRVQASKGKLTQPPIAGRQQFMLWWSGLRGGVAFALAVSAAHKYGRDGKFMETSVFLICVLTVLVNGGASPYLLEKLGLLQRQCGEDELVVPDHSAAMAKKLAAASKKLATRYPSVGQHLDKVTRFMGGSSHGRDVSANPSTDPSTDGDVPSCKAVEPLRVDAAPATAGPPDTLTRLSGAPAVKPVDVEGAVDTSKSLRS